MKIHQLSVDAALASVQSGPEGLAPGEAQRRLREFGPNELPRAPRVSLVRRFLAEFFHFFALILWFAAILAFLAEYREPGQGMRLLGFAILGVILVNGVFSFWQANRAEQAFVALQQLLPREVQVRRGNNAYRVPASQLVPGDVVFLAAGDQVPADACVIEAFGVRVNNATITGESIPHSRRAEASEAIELQDSANVVMAGTSLVSGSATVLVFATGPQTAVGRIACLTQEEQTPPSPLQQEVARLSRMVAGLSVALGLPFWSNFVFAIGIIVANVPEGLLPTLTLALAMPSQRMARRQALIRQLRTG